MGNKWKKKKTWKKQLNITCQSKCQCHKARTELPERDVFRILLNIYDGAF